MKRLKFSIFAFLIVSVILLLPIFTAGVLFERNYAGGFTYVYGESDDEIESIASLAKYDPRNELTPVKDQGDSNLCWAYSAINASEASIIKNRLGDKDTLRLNPRALAYRKYVRNADPLNNNASYHDKYYGEWTSRSGHVGHTASVLSMWQGPIAGDLPAADVWENSLYRLESARLILSGLTGDARIAEIKRAIAEYGAVTASCYYDGGTKQYYNDKAVSNGIAHAITLVGWDDGIDKGLFKPGQVSKNGGWLVKNSYIDNAYFWLTYESKIADTTAWAFTYAPRETYDFNYYYDNVVEDNALLKLKSCANVFEAKKGTADKDEYIEAVNIGFAGSDVSVKVKVYTNLKGWGQTSVDSGFLAAEKTQTFKYGGYNTVKLDTPVKVKAGTYFSVVTEVSNAANNAYVSVVQSDTKKPSFRKVSDGYDTMFYGSGVARIKAYTKLKNAKPDNAEHTLGNLIRKVNATCTETGLKAHYRCADCGKYFDETKTETTLSHLIIAIDPLAHDFDSWVNEIAANCTETGVKGHKDCKLCGKHFDANGKEITDLTIAANDDHDWNAWESNRDGTHTSTCKRRLSHTERVACSGGTATCTQAAVCVFCKGTYGNTSAHAYGALVDEKRSTCQKEGVKAHYKCSVCEKYFDEDKTETTFEALQLPLNPNAHEFDVWRDEVYATCKDTGVKGHKDCKLCGKHFDRDGKEIKELTTPTTNKHTYGAWIDEVPATENVFGTKGHKDCKICGKHFDRDGTELTDLTIAKIGTHQVVVNGENKIYKEGETVTVTADEPQEGKEFKGWQDASGTIVTTDKSYTFTVTGEISLIAVYGDKPEVNPSKNEGLSSGAIAGIVIGSVVFAGIAGFNFVWFAVNKKSFADLLAVIKKIFRRG